MKELLDCHLLSVEHQSGHVIVVGVRPNGRTEVVPRLILERRVTLHGTSKWVARLVSSPGG